MVSTLVDFVKAILTFKIFGEHSNEEVPFREANSNMGYWSHSREAHLDYIVDNTFKLLN